MQPKVVAREGSGSHDSQYCRAWSAKGRPGARAARQGGLDVGGASIGLGALAGRGAVLKGDAATAAELCKCRPPMGKNCEHRADKRWGARVSDRQRKGSEPPAPTLGLASKSLNRLTNHCRSRRVLPMRGMFCVCHLNPVRRVRSVHTSGRAAARGVHNVPTTRKSALVAFTAARVIVPAGRHWGGERMLNGYGDGWLP